MPNEKQILNELALISADVAALKERVTELEREKKGIDIKPSIAEQLKAIDGLANLLDDDEKISFGAFMDAEENRKAKIYG